MNDIVTASNETCLIKRCLNNRPLMDKVDTYSLRGLCMIMIILHHVYKVFVQNYGYPSNMIDRYWGDLGTGVFFLISGYGLFCSLFSGKYKLAHYWFLSFSKLLFPFFIAFGLSIFATSFISKEPIDIFCIIRDFFTLTIPNTTTWFFKVIIAYYLISFICFALIKKNQIALLVIVGCTILYFFFGKYIFHFSPYLFCTTINFPLGMLFAAYQKGVSINQKLFGLFFFFILFCLYMRFRFDYSLCFYSPLFSFLCVFLCSVINLANPIFDFIGKKSIIFYLVHISILHQLSLSIHNEWMLLLLLTIITAIIAIAYSKFHFVGKFNN